MSDLVHGVEVLFVQSGPRTIQTPSTSVIGISGTAFKGPVNVTTLVTGPRDAADKFGVTGTIGEALQDIYGVSNAIVVVENVLDPSNEDHVTTVANEALGTGYAKGSVISLVNGSIAAFTSLIKDQAGTNVELVEGTDYTLDYQTGEITLSASITILPTDTLHANYKAANFAAVTPAEIAGTPAGGDGVYALLGAESLIGVRPRIIIAPGAGHFENDVSAATAVPGALLAVADALMGCTYIEGPNTTAAEAYTAHGLVSGVRRLADFLDPWIETPAGLRPPSAFAAAVRAKTDAELGVHYSISMQPIPGVTGVGRPISEAEADILNGQHITTVVRRDGYRWKGMRSMDTIDPRWQQSTASRIATIIADAVKREHDWALAKPILKTYFSDVTEGVKVYLRGLTVQGVIAGGDCWADPELNSVANLSVGHVYINFDFAPTPGAEKITFLAEINNGYLASLVAA